MSDNSYMEDGFTYRTQEELESYLLEWKMIFEKNVFDWFEEPLKISINQWKKKGIKLNNAIVYKNNEQRPVQVYPFEIL